jgi:hypothetical protein
MATSSYASLFGTTGSGKKQGVGFGNLFGQQEAPKAAQMQPKAAQPQAQPTKTFAQMQAAGEARPAPQQMKPPAQPPMLQQLQDQLQMPVLVPEDTPMPAPDVPTPSPAPMTKPSAPPLPAGLAPAGPDTTITTTAMPGEVNPWTGEIMPSAPPPTPTAPGAPPAGAPPAGAPTTEAPPAGAPPTPTPTGPGAGAGGGPATPSSAYDDLIRQIQDILKQPAGYSNEEMAKIRAARTAELEETFGGQRSALEEEMARRGLAASTIGSGRFGDLAGQQARALSTLEANLLQQQMDAQDRARAQQLTTLSALSGQRADIWQGELERQLREKLGLAEYTGKIDGQETFATQLARQNLLIQLAGILAQGGGATAGAMPQLLKLLADQFGFQLTGTGTGVGPGYTPGGGGYTPSPTPTGTATGATLPPPTTQF